MLRAVALALVLVALAVAVMPSQATPASSGPSGGTSIEYALRSSGGAPDGSFRVVTESTLVLRFVDGAWTGTCTGVRTTDAYGSVTPESFTQASPMAPARMPGRLHRGETVDPVLLSAASEGCRHDLGELVVAGRASDGTKSMLATESAQANAYQDAALSWDAKTGLVRSWSFAGHGGGFEGVLVSASSQ